MNCNNTRLRASGGWKLAALRFVVASTLLTISTGVANAADKITTRGNQVLYGGVAKGYAGNSLFWSNTGWGAEKYYNANVVRWLKQDWNSKIVRAAMGVEDAGGYLSDPQGNKNRVRTVVEAAIAQDIYVIIDWHSHNAENYTNQAVTFFQEMAQRYGNSNNVIYEIYNEPINSSWSGQIKPYAETVIAAIRAIDPDNLIIVGTPFYSQNVDQAAADPIRGYSNIAYALHFYAGSHGEGLRNKVRTALNAGIPIFVSEWGAVNANGDGGVATGETNQWINFMKQNNLSHLNWSMHDKQEGASALRPGASTSGGWSQSNLTASGNFVRNIVRDYNQGGSSNPNPPPAGSSCSSANAFGVPGLIQAENYCAMSGIRKVAAQDSGGTELIGWIRNGDWTSYAINVPSPGTYRIEARVASDTAGGRINMVSGGTNVGSIPISNTGGWQTWQTKTVDVQLPAGRQILRFNYSGGQTYLFNVNWIKINSAGSTNPPPSGGNGGVVCEFILQDQWNGGFVGAIRITNNGSSTISGNWSVNWRYTDGSTVTNAWNGEISGSNPYSMRPLSWNRTIPPSGSVEFGLQHNKGNPNASARAPNVSGSICN